MNGSKRFKSSLRRIKSDSVGSIGVVSWVLNVMGCRRVSCSYGEVKVVGGGVAC